MQAGEAASWEVPPLQVSASKAKLTVNPEWLQQLQVRHQLHMKLSQSLAAPP